MDPLVKRMRDYLPALRLTAGWSSERLAAMLGISRTTMVSIERGHHQMTKTQYLAITCLLEREAKNNAALKKVMDIVFDDTPLGDQSREDLIEIVNAAKKMGCKKGCVAASEKIRELITA